MRDFQAVRNTIKLGITNGITEGYVNKLKAIKRNMYGRAGIELLKNKIVISPSWVQVSVIACKLL